MDPVASPPPSPPPNNPQGPPGPGPAQANPPAVLPANPAPAAVVPNIPAPVLPVPVVNPPVLAPVPVLPEPAAVFNAQPNAATVPALPGTSGLQRRRRLSPVAEDRSTPGSSSTDSAPDLNTVATPPSYGSGRGHMRGRGRDQRSVSRNLQTDFESDDAQSREPSTPTDQPIVHGRRRTPEDINKDRPRPQTQGRGGGGRGRGRGVGGGGHGGGGVLTRSRSRSNNFIG